MCNSRSPIILVSGNKKAVFIGINYTGMPVALNGCINDVHNIRNFLQQRYGFLPNHCVQLTDDQEEAKFLPTRANIIAAMKWLVQDAQPGDSLFLHYSGHGATAEDMDGDEKDGQDETIVPLDYQTAGMIVDDDLHAILVKPLQEGVRLTTIFDCCHSGTILDLPFTYKCSGEIEVIADSHHKEAAKALLLAGVSLTRGMYSRVGDQYRRPILTLTYHVRRYADAQRRAEKMRRSDADVVQFSGCRDDQTSADANIDNVATGAMSYALIKVLNQHDSITYTDLLHKLRDELKGKYTQIPQMSTGRPMDMNSEFIM
ncbi:peptidase C14, caspase domain-containing protein [Thamnocephalis sphaerospora]|uniref:Peptidase C14, caspase domain-containing protein n=1 Tax=Thamnocephalis sphaerospora TaxID=78915 RepID=A0A4P9XXC3_9FUNG|nr:peptidase C14, caspase domain-containing protein [Thamnocephalis sphaerospora]|eukprot:RKP10957.1 peptidase C14, caspase domain-containing protein [Thamnocephalis sphaerospora]